MTATDATTPVIPTDIAAAAVLPESYRDEDTYRGAYKWLREHMPLAQAQVQGYDPLWLVTKFDDIRQIERDPDSFHAGDENPILNDQANDAFQRSMNNGSIRVLDVHPYLDQPEHRQVRLVANDWFSAANQRTFAEEMRRHARNSVEQLLELGDEADFYTDFAQAFPLRVIMSLMGVPESEELRMHKLTQEFFGTHDPDMQRNEVRLEPTAAAQMWAAAIADFFAYFSELSADRRANPRQDLATLLVNSTMNGAPLEERYINGYYLAALTAGHDTTAATIAGGMWGLLRYPEQWSKLKADPGAIKGFVDESVRWTSPVRHFMRSAAREVQIRGQHIGAGDRLMLLFASANRDEDHFVAPDEFRIDRIEPHIGFGFGPHMCIGMHTAKLEMTILWEELLPHLSSVELAGEVKLAPTNFVGGLQQLPIRFKKA
jgi:cytochrome P450